MRWWSVANFVSNAGTWMQLTVQNLLVLQITGSAAATGLSMSVQAAPALLISVLGGAAVDRWPRRLTAAVSQALLGTIAFVTALMVALDRLDVTSLMVLAAITGVVATVDGPACSLLGNDLVPAEDVPSAIGVGALVHQAGRLTGAALAGVTVGFLGTAAAYAANGLSFLFVASVIPFLRPAKGAVKHAATARPRDALSVREGLAFFARRPRLLALAGVTGVSAVFGRNYQLTLAVLVTGPPGGRRRIVRDGLHGAGGRRHRRRGAGRPAAAALRAGGGRAGRGGRAAAGRGGSVAVAGGPAGDGAADGRRGVGLRHRGHGGPADRSARAHAGPGARGVGQHRHGVEPGWSAGAGPAHGAGRRARGARRGGLVIAGAIGAGHVLHGRRPVEAVAVRGGDTEAPARAALGTAA